jgi:hypothetical protein
MRYLIRVIPLAALLVAMPCLCGCKNSMRIAHDMVEAETIGRDIKTLSRGVDMDGRSGE